jgi:hypothetical protein
MEDVLASTMTIRCVGYEKKISTILMILKPRNVPDGKAAQAEKRGVISTVKYRLDHKSLGTTKRMTYHRCTLKEY